MNRLWLMLPIIIGVLLLGPNLGNAQGFQREMTILMGEFFFQVEGQDRNETIVLESGVPYRVTFRNVGNTVHRVKFGRGLIIEEGVPFAYTENLFDDVPLQIEGVSAGDIDFRVLTDRLLELDLDPGGEMDIVFTLPQNAQGAWELGCFVIGHYEAGMLAPLTVQ